MKTEVLQKKACNYFIMAGLALILFAVVYTVIQPKTIEVTRAMVASGIFLSLYFAVQGHDLLNIIKKGKFDVERYICFNIEKSGFRGQSRSVVFFQSETKKPFIFNAKSNIEFTEWMEYDIYFRKGHRTTNSVLAISMSDPQKQCTPYNQKEIEEEVK